MKIIIDDKLNGKQDSKSGHAARRVMHGFFGRQGGVSHGIYDSLNCGSGSNDDPISVQKNRSLVAQHFGQSLENLVSVWQVHSPDCLYVDAPFKGDKPQADAMVTDKTGLVLGVLTADCGPVLFAGEKTDGASVVGAAHSGWGGALKGVNEATVQKMLDCGAQLETIRAAIGPCIGVASYEVSEGYEKPFLERDIEDERFFKSARKEGHLMFDMAGYIANRLAQIGVKQVTITGQDTFALKEDYFSYRRATHENAADYGRQISAIMISSKA
jgi:YfiH family protein